MFLNEKATENSIVKHMIEVKISRIKYIYLLKKENYVQEREETLYTTEC